MLSGLKNISSSFFKNLSLLLLVAFLGAPAHAEEHLNEHQETELTETVWFQKSTQKKKKSQHANQRAANSSEFSSPNNELLPDYNGMVPIERLFILHRSLKFYD